MKVLVSGTLAKYVFDDDETLIVEDNQIITANYSIGDLNSSNSWVYTDVDDVPEDFEGNWYNFDGNNWVMTAEHPDYVEG